MCLTCITLGDSSAQSLRGRAKIRIRFEYKRTQKHNNFPGNKQKLQLARAVLALQSGES